MKRNNIEEEIDLLLETKANVATADGTNKRKGFGMSRKTFKGVASLFVMLLSVLVVSAGVMLFNIKTDTTLDTDYLYTFDSANPKETIISRTIDGVGGEWYNFTHFLNSTHKMTHNRVVNFSWSGDLDEGISYGLFMDGSHVYDLVIEPNTQYVMVESYYLDPMINPEESYNLVCTATIS